MNCSRNARHTPFESGSKNEVKNKKIYGILAKAKIEKSVKNAKNEQKRNIRNKRSLNRLTGIYVLLKNYRTKINMMEKRNLNYCCVDLKQKREGDRMHRWIK